MTNLLGIYEKALPPALSWPKRLEEAKAAGFDFLEISIDESDERLARLKWNVSMRRELRRASEDVGLPIDTMCLSGHRKYPLGSTNPDIEIRSLGIMQEALTLAADLGVRIIQLAGYDVYYEESTSDTRLRFIDNLAKSVEMASSYGIILALETMETPFCNTVQKAMNFVAKINSPYLQVYPDIGNVRNATDNVIEDLRTGKGHIVAAHLKETKEKIFRDLHYGEGRVDFPTYIEELLALGIHKFNAEFWFDGGDNWREELLRANRFLKQYL
ncbi:MAG: L-ribulose-5-phosphate 3-epimerase [Roseburia sp.]|nr:L-ribulose-5-phosphate 3-epimerase [Roseburia sp.]